VQRIPGYSLTPFLVYVFYWFGSNKTDPIIISCANKWNIYWTNTPWFKRLWLP